MLIFSFFIYMYVYIYIYVSATEVAGLLQMVHLTQSFFLDNVHLVKKGNLKLAESILVQLKAATTPLVRNINRFWNPTRWMCFLN